MQPETNKQIASRRLKACAFWNDEAGANAWIASQKQDKDSERERGEFEAARLWAQAKRLHLQADAILAADIAEAA